MKPHISTQKTRSSFHHTSPVAHLRTLVYLGPISIIPQNLDTKIPSKEVSYFTSVQISIV